MSNKHQFVLLLLLLSIINRTCTYLSGSFGSRFFFFPFTTTETVAFSAPAFFESSYSIADGDLKAFCKKKKCRLLLKEHSQVKRETETEREFQFINKEKKLATEMSINHNQRNKFSLVSLHVCSINSDGQRRTSLSSSSSFFLQFLCNENFHSLPISGE
jgi:hypothetical protein